MQVPNHESICTLQNLQSPGCKFQYYEGENLANAEHCSQLACPIQEIMMLAVPTQDYTNHMRAKSLKQTLNII